MNRAFGRLVSLVPILFGVVLLVFLAVRAVPGDPAQIMLGERATPETLAQLRHELGLDRPVPVQFASYVGQLARGDLGRSIQSGESVAIEIAHRAGATIELSVTALAIALVVGIPLGCLAAVKRNGWVDVAASGVSLVGVSMPIFWLGLLLMLLFAATWRVLPLSGRLDLALDVAPVTGLLTVDTLLQGQREAFVDALRHLVLPACTLATVPLATLVRMTRAAMLEVLGSEHVRAARAKGVPEVLVVLRHALSNAWVPIVTVAGLQLGTLLSGAVLTETLFSWPGVGTLAVGAVFARDFPLLQGCVLVFALTFVAVNWGVDWLYGRLDPRLRSREEA